MTCREIKRLAQGLLTDTGQPVGEASIPSGFPGSEDPGVVIVRLRVIRASEGTAKGFNKLFADDLAGRSRKRSSPPWRSR